MPKDDYLADIQWQRFVAVPKPGQSIDDDDCPHASLLNATVRDMTTFLLHEPPYVDKTTREKLAQLVNYARAKAKPDDNFLESIGIPPDALEKLRASRGASRD